MSRDLIRPLLALGLGLFGMAALGPVYNTFVPIFLHDYGLSATMVGFVMTWDNWLNVFVSPWTGHQSDIRWTRIGRRAPWIIVGVALALFFVFIPLAPSLGMMLIVLVITNLGLSIGRSPGLALLGDMFPPSQRSTASGVINVFGGLGAVAALVASRYLYPINPIAPFVFTGLLLLVGGVILVLGIRERRETFGESATILGFRSQFRSLLKDDDRSGLYLLLGIFFGFCGFNAAETWLSTYAFFALDVPEAQLTLLMAAFAGALLLGAIPSGMLAARWGQKRMVLMGMVALAVVFLLVATVHSQSAMYIMLAFSGLAWAPILVNTLPLMYDVGRGQQFGALTGFYFVSLSLAAILGPQLVGLALDISGRNYSLIWIIAAAFMLIGILFMMKIQSAAPHDS